MATWQDEYENGIMDSMWTMFQMGQQKANLPQLEECCKMLIRMATQKTAGQRGKESDIPWTGSLNMTLMNIAVEATCLVLDKRFPKLKEEWEADED